LGENYLSGGIVGFLQWAVEKIKWRERQVIWFQGPEKAHTYR